MTLRDHDPRLPGLHSVPGYGFTVETVTNVTAAPGAAEFDLLVVGGGSGGFAAAITAAAVPWVGFTLGVAMALLAVLVLAGKRIALPGHVFRAVGQQGQGGVFLVGAGYGVTALGCGLPLFLAAVGAAVAAGGRFAAVAVVAAYAAGMAATLMTLAIAMAAIRDRVIRLVGRAQSLMRWVNGALLLLAGGYLSYYWATVLFTSMETRGRDPLITAIDRFGRLTQRWFDTDAGGWVLVAVIVASAAAALRWLWRRARTERTPHQTADTVECGCSQTTEKVISS